MKKVFALFIAVALIAVCIVLLPLETKAATVEAGTCGANLTWTLDDQGTLTISGTGNMTNYSNYGAPWFNNKTYGGSLKKVVIESGVTSIGNAAFYGLHGLKEVSIPDTVTKIGEDAFGYCDSLLEVIIPNGVRTIPRFTFSNCTSLTTIVIPSSVQSFGDMAFNRCSSLEYVIIPSGVTTLPYSMFAGCSGLEYISIPSTVTRIHPQVFDDCGNLWDIYYAGTSSQYKGITIDSFGNEQLENATIHYSSKAPCRTHTYGSYTKVSDTQHSRTCSNCGYVETVSHKWNNGTVTKAATCKETGSKTYTCTGCNATKAETIAKLTTHTYGNWIKVNDTTHKHTCSVCQKEETVSHSWNSTVTKAATCKEEGVKTFTCTACKTTKTETIAKLTTHTYDNACDTDCNVCGHSRTITHNYKTSWSKDKTNHWHECSVCKDKKDQAAHTPGAEATETTAQTCTICGYVIKSALGHTHNYADTWTTDENGHWYACSGCEETGNYAAHTPGAEATATTDQICTICGEVLAKATGETTTTPPATQTTVPPSSQPTTEPPTQPTTEPSDTNNTTQPENAPAEPNNPADPTVWIIVAVVLLGGGAAGIIIWKKKH